MRRVDLTEIKEWGEGRKFSKEPLELCSGVVVVDRAKFYDSHLVNLEGLKTREEKLRKRMFYDRLARFYLLINNEC